MQNPEKISIVNYFSTILNHVCDIVVGVERIIGIYHSDNSNKSLSGISLTYRNNQLLEEQIQFESSSYKTESFISTNGTYKWIDKTQLPFEISSNNKKQLTIFSEENNLVLVIPIQNTYITKKDFICIYFKEGIDQFGVSHQKNNLSTQNKTIIGHLVAKSVNSLSKTYLEQENKFKQFVDKTRQIFTNQKNKVVNKQLDQYEQFIKAWAISILNELGDSDGVNYVYNDEALQKILKSDCGYNEIKKSIIEAVEYVKYLSVYQIQDEAIIEPEYITFVNFKDTYVNFENNDNSLSPKLVKTKELLDKLEKYSILVSQNNLNLTSYNVGRAMERPITPAAISDAISKNKERINILFKQFPDKWNFIKNNFRPIINITEMKFNDLTKFG